MKQNIRFPKYRYAFSLIELLVVIGIIGILLAIILPGLSGARASAMQLQSLSNLRQIYIVFEDYSSEYNDAHPFGTGNMDLNKGGKGKGNFKLGTKGTNGIGMNFGNNWSITGDWPVIVSPIAPWGKFQKVFIDPGVDLAERPFPLPSYVYSASFVARPQTWRENAEPKPEYLKPTFASEVRTPSQKVFLWDGDMPYLRDGLKWKGFDIDIPVPCLFRDGHAELKTPSRATDPIHNPFIKDDGKLSIGRLFNTENGVLGRDY